MPDSARMAAAARPLLDKVLIDFSLSDLGLLMVEVYDRSCSPAVGAISSASKTQARPRHNRPLRNVGPRRRFVPKLPEAVVLILEVFVEKVEDPQAHDAAAVGQSIPDPGVHRDEAVTTLGKSRNRKSIHVLVHISDAQACEEARWVEVADRQGYAQRLYFLRDHVAAGAEVALVVIEDHLRAYRYLWDGVPVGIAADDSFIPVQLVGESEGAARRTK